MAKKKEKIPPPGKKGEPSTKFYTRKKWRAMLGQSPFEVCGKELSARGALIVGNALTKNRFVVRCDLSCNDIGDEGAIAFADVLRGNSVMQHLNLSQNNIGDVGGIALASAFIPNVTATGQPGQWNRTLFTMTLLGNEMGDDTLLAFSNAAACHRDLALVDLSWNHVGPQGTKCFMRSFQRNNLCNFLLSANEISDEGTEHLCDALLRYGGKSQTTVNLYRNDISHRGAAAIGRLLAAVETIQEVNLSGNTLGQRGAKVLKEHLLTIAAGAKERERELLAAEEERAAAGSPVVSGSPTSAFLESATGGEGADEAGGERKPPRVPGLRSLNLSDNVMGDEGAEELASIVAADLPALQRLDMADNQISERGACLLIKALQSNTHLEVVDLSGNRFGPKSAELVVELIRTSRTLRALNLSKCVASDEHRRAINLAVGESDGLHVELGSDEAAGGGGGFGGEVDASETLLGKAAEHWQTVADQEAQRLAEAKAAKKGKKKKKSVAK